MKMKKFRKKPVVIEAIRYDGTNGPEIAECCGQLDADDQPGRVEIRTLEGTMRADVGDWIIRGVKGEFYPCKPDIFDATYDPVEEPGKPQ